MPTPIEASLAVLIDADNASTTHLEALLNEIATLGRSNVRRAYGDWTKPQLASWKSVLLSYSIQPIQQFSYTNGKNATDSSLIIDAMDLLYKGRLDGFCLVSSDSDFTRLAQRIREEGLIVYGFGKKHTPKAFMQACDRFTYLEVFEEQKKTANVDFYDSADMLFSDNNQFKPVDVAIALVKSAIDSMADEHGWANIAPVKNYILKVEPDFDSRLFNYDKFSDFLKAYPRYFELAERYPNGDNHKVVFVRNRRNDVLADSELTI
ncbi:MAG: NYN domain-containing protein [Moraxella sp.]|uniref:NYN domain-containing protein n=1 Tax=Moraxella sp. TaxID=479 RepID=UPI0026DB7E80|nr:NYN domain-containing protein [Moraxella sp.]MDO4451104.1 NYN domain-containing protein [Moraxella sp.]